jgi:hypothetical protein
MVRQPSNHGLLNGAEPRSTFTSNNCRERGGPLYVSRVLQRSQACDLPEMIGYSYQLNLYDHDLDPPCKHGRPNTQGDILKV